MRRLARPPYRLTFVVLLAVSISLVGEFINPSGPGSTSPELMDNFPAPLSSWDTSLFVWVNITLSDPSVFGILSVLTLLGSLSGSVILCGLLLLTGQRKKGILASASIILVTALTTAFKVAIARPRPFMVVPGAISSEPESGYAFPSGHVSRIFSLVHVTKGANRVLRLSGYVITGLVAFSRVYLGVHYPLDVLGGTVVGLASGWAVRRYEPRLLSGAERLMAHLGVSSPLTL